MKFKMLIVAFLVLVVAGNIHVIRGDSVGSSSQSSETLVPPLNVTFRAKIDESIATAGDSDCGSYAIFNDKICFNALHTPGGGRSHSLFIMDLNTGNIIWSYDAEATTSSLDGIHSYANLLLVQLDYTGEPPVGVHTWPTGGRALMALDTATREIVWKFPTKNPGIWRLQARDGIVYFIANYEGIYALNVSTGKVKWLYPELPDPESSSGAKGFNDLLLTQDTIYASTSGVLVALDRSTGKEKSRFDFGNASVTAAMEELVLARNVLYGNIYEYYDTNKILNYSFIAFDPLTERFLWKTFRSPFPCGGYSNPIVTNDSVYVIWSEEEKKDQFGGDYLNRVYALNASTGKVRWHSQYGMFGSSYPTPPMVLDGPYLYVLGHVNVPYDTNYRYYATITAFDTRTGEKVWNYTINRERDDSWTQGGLLCSNGTGSRTLYLIALEFYSFDKPTPEGVVGSSEYVVYGLGPSSTKPVPELPNTSLILTVSILALIPILFRKRWRCEHA
jgi:outer membrane protein assembly factor BamB